MARRPKLTQEMVDEAIRLKADGLSNGDIICALGIHESTFYRWIGEPKNKLQRALSEGLKKEESAFKRTLLTTIRSAALARNQYWTAGVCGQKVGHPRRGVGTEVRMHSRETVGLFLLAREDGMTLPEAAAFAGVALRTAKHWSRGRLPRSYTGERPARVESAGGTGGTGTGGPMGKRVAGGPYGPAEAGPLSGMTSEQIENLLLRAVLDDLKGGGSHPLSTPMGSRCELGARLRRATGLPTSAITRFLEIPRSTWYYHLRRAGRDGDAWLRPYVAEAFEECGRRGYRCVHATLRAHGVRVSEKRVRRIMAEDGLAPRRRRARRYSSYRGEVSPAPVDVQ